MNQANNNTIIMQASIAGRLGDPLQSPGFLACAEAAGASPSVPARFLYTEREGDCSPMPGDAC